jgi:hypothetical protein
MKRIPSSEASIPNPKLQRLTPLIGEWHTIGTHPYVPGTTFHGYASFEWLEGGAFLMMRSEIDEPQIPTGIAIVGSDDSDEEYFMLYFDERGVSRKYVMTIRDNVWQWSRNAPGFSQRFTCTIVDNGQTMIGKGELSKDGVSWEKDLDLTYTRIV